MKVIFLNTPNSLKWKQSLDAFCALFHDNPDGKNLYNQLEAQGNNEIKKATSNWREIIMEWKES